MLALIQRVSEASVSVSGQIVGQIQQGFLVLLGVTHSDTPADTEWLAQKILGMRLFADTDGKMNLDLAAVKGNILLVSQFTLHSSTKKGNRPSFLDAASPALAIPLYQAMIQKLETGLGHDIATGVFGANMQVSLVNDGPVTIIIDSKNKT
jgi:D-aminoacyl-tRNA deacylase